MIAMPQLETTARDRRRLSENVQRLLADRSWSKSELTRRAGFDHRMTVQRVLDAEHTAGFDVVLAIARAFNTTVDFLFRDPAENFPDG